MAKRNGVHSISKVARSMCRLVSKFSAVLYLQFPASTALHVALAAALAACQVLQNELEAVKDYGD